MRKTFLSLSPKEGVTYSQASLIYFGILEPINVNDDPNVAILLKEDGEVYLAKPVGVANKYTGERYPLELVTD